MRQNLLRGVSHAVLGVLLVSCADVTTSPRTVGGKHGPATHANTVPTAKIVISQVYGAGGNSGALLQNDYVELFNAGDAPQSLAGWSVQYGSTTGNFASSGPNLTLLSGTVEPGKYFLVKMSGGTIGAPLPTADVTGSASMAAGAGKVIVARTTSPVACNGASCTAAQLALIVDLVGYGSGTGYFEGTGPTGTISTTLAAFRKDDGCFDLDDNAGDFTTGAPAPRNSQSDRHQCVIAGDLDHVDITGPTNVIAGATITLNATLRDADGLIINRPSTMTWTSSDPTIATVLSTTRTSAVIKGLVPGGPVTFTVTATVGSVSKTANPSVTVRPAPVLAPSTTFVSEIHYDDPSVDANERIEIEGDAGSSLQGWSLVLYNGNGGVPYSTTPLSGLIPANCTNGRGVVVIAFPTDGIQNGSPDGWALVNAQNQVTEFRSYEGTMTATDGPAFGIPSTAIDVDESSAPPDTRSVQRAGNGVWFGPMSNTFGRCNAAVPPPPQKILVADGKELIALGMQTQFFYSGVDNSGQPLASVTWSTSDPSIITVDQKGILTAKQLGTAQLIATAPDGAFGTAEVTVYLAPTATFPLRLGHNEEFGEPVDGDASNDFLIHRAQYTVSYNPARGGANWVSWNLSASHIGNSGRCEGTCYSADTVLSKAGLPAYTTADWVSNATWDRGHMAPSADWTSSEADNNTTFFLTNFLPQAPDLNQGPWERLEAALRDSVGTGREVYIIAGGIFTNGSGLGSILNLGKIWIPDSTYKIAIITPAGTGIGSNGTLPPNTTVMAVNMPNVQHIRGVSWTEYLTTIGRIEQSTGYNFLDLLSEPTECVVENRACSAAQGIADIGGSVASLGLGSGNANSLTAKLDNAARALASGNVTSAKNMIEAFINEVNAGMRSGRIARTAGDDAIALARRVLAIM